MEKLLIMVEPPPLFLDFEASSLASASYPIEVAWTRQDGAIESHLISPAGIERWTNWSVQAEQLHGITRAQLLAEGQTPAWISRRLNDQLNGRVVYTDAPDYDGAWLAELFSVTWGIVPSFALTHVDDLLIKRLTASCGRESEAQRMLLVFKAEARQHLPQRHRARWDVEYLVKLWRLVTKVAPQPILCGV